jgi:hypothetical protein
MDDLSGATFANYALVTVNFEEPFRDVQNNEVIPPWVREDGTKSNWNLKRTGYQFSTRLDESIDGLRNRVYLNVSLHRSLIGVENQLGLRCREPKARSVIGTPDQFVAESARIEI